MIHLANKDNTNENTASLIVGSDLKVEEFSAGWRAAGLPVISGSTRKSVDKLFPQGDAAAYAREVLASAEARENVVLQLGAADAGRYLCANFYPLPLGAKPGRVKKVLMEGWETKAAMVLEGAGAVIEAFQPAEAFRQNSVDLASDAGWRVG